MDIQKGTPAESGNGMEQFSHFGKIDVLDDFIRAAVEDADLPALMATLP